MKDSGIDWLGEIPETWNIIHLKYLCNITTGGRDTIERDEKGQFPFYVRSPIIERINSYSFDGEAILMAGDGVGAGKVFHYVNEKFDYHQRVYNLHNFRNVYPKYLFHFLKENFIKIVERGNAKSTVDSIRLPMLKDFPVTSCGMDNENKIADYLDKKVAELDSIIEKTKSTIIDYKLLKQSIITEAVTKGLNKNVEMKDSGIEWIGEVPKSWKLGKIKDIFNVYSGSTPSSSVNKYWEGDITWITPSDFKTEDIYIGNSKRKISKEGLKSCGTVIVPKDSVILSSRAPIGSVVVSEVELCTNQGCKALVKKDESIIPKYYYYYLAVLTEQLNMLGRGTTFLEISASESKKFWVPVPDRDTQLDIVMKLDKVIGGISELVMKKERLISDLEAYKKSLIYECVTGKKEVI